MFLLLINDDEADVFQRGEDGAPGAHHDIRAAVLDHLPLEQALGVIERRVLDGHPPPEPALEAEDHLRRQADLRHQHEGAASQCQTPLDELQEHQRLAAAGDAVEEGRVRGSSSSPGSSAS